MEKKFRLLLLLALLMTAATGAWADNTVTWEGATLKSVNVASYESNKTQTIGDITVTANSGYFKDFGSGNNGVIASAYETNGLVFSANAKFKSVEVTASSESTFNHTSGSVTSHTYTVNPTATSFALPYGDGWINITKIVFTFEDAAAEPAGYTVSMKDDVKDANNWTVKVGEGQAQALPIGGLKGDGTETVTLQYNGRLKVKGVKATSDAAPAAVPVTAITLNKTETSIKVGATETLSVSSVTPDDATDQTVTWSSDNDAVATVDADGKVTAVAFGTANITATANDGSGVTATCAVTVSKVVTINQSDWGGWDTPFTKDGVTVSAGMIDPKDGNLMEGGTFSTTLGNFTKIEVTTGHFNASGIGWSGSMQSGTWTGTPASSVSFSGEIMGMGMGQTTIVCTIVPTN